MSPLPPETLQEQLKADNVLMTAQIVQIRDYQSRRAIERAHKELEKEATKILSAVGIPVTDTSPSEMIPYHGAGIDGMVFPDNDPA